MTYTYKIVQIYNLNTVAYNTIITTDSNMHISLYSNGQLNKKMMNDFNCWTYHLLITVVMLILVRIRIVYIFVCQVSILFHSWKVDVVMESTINSNLLTPSDCLLFFPFLNPNSRLSFTVFTGPVDDWNRLLYHEISKLTYKSYNETINNL